MNNDDEMTLGSKTCFVIDSFDFGVDAARSSLSVTDSSFVLKLVGDDAIIAATIGQEDHPWYWLIQPPFLYAIGVPCEVDSNGDFEHDITEQELDDYDIALYAMEHCDVLPCHLSKKGKVVAVSGQVHRLRETPVDFYGRFEV
jgi:hypothetical protein